jgi:hypothetical protein
MAQKKAGGNRMNPSTIQSTLIAENHITISRSLFDEGMSAIQRTSYKKSTRHLAVILTVLFVAVAAYFLYNGIPLIFLLGECIFLGALMFWISVMLPKSRRRSKYKVMSQNGAITPERTVLFYDDHLKAVTNNGKETVISYEDVQSCLETSHLWILNCNGNLGILLSKDGFTQGSFDGLKGLIPAPVSE